MCCLGEELLNWHWMQDFVIAFNLKFKVRISTKYRDAISLRIRVFEWWRPKTVMCLDTMSASNKLLGKTSLFSLRFGEVWNNTACIFWSFLARVAMKTLLMLGARNATRARYLSKASRKPFYASQASIFNSPDHIDTALTRCCGSLLWPDCTLSPLDNLL